MQIRRGDSVPFKGKTGNPEEPKDTKGADRSDPPKGRSSKSDKK